MKGSLRGRLSISFLADGEDGRRRNGERRGKEDVVTQRRDGIPKRGRREGKESECREAIMS